MDGDTYHLSLPGAGIYQVWTATPSGTSSIEEVQVNCYDETFDCENPYAVNYDATASNPDELACIYDTCVCDCAGTSHSMGVLTFLGDGELEDESEGKTWNDNPVHLRCNVWGFDCGDAGINFDPYGVCEGNLPPNNGCSSPGCSPLTIAISAAPCQTGPNGLESVISMTFGASDGCNISELYYQVNSGPWVIVDLSAEGGYSNGDVYLLEGAEPSATYQCYTTTSSGAVSPYFTFQNGELCSSPTDFCDCDGNTWPESFTSYIGNGTNNDGITPENGFYINFNCLAWSYDCGDGSGTADPFGVCEGNFQPSRGCQEYSFGCTDDTACNFEPTAVTDDGTCDYSCQGCTDPLSCNFNPLATEEDGSCEFSSCAGCTYPEASNYNAEANFDNGSCLFNTFDPCLGDMNSDGVIGVQDLIMLLQVYGFICE